MKDQLIGPATIADLKRQGMIGILVRCALPCRHTAAVRFDALGLPDETPYARIAALKRLRCRYCDRVATAGDLTVDRGPLGGWGILPPGGPRPPGRNER